MGNFVAIATETVVDNFLAIAIFLPEGKSSIASQVYRGHPGLLTSWTDHDDAV